MFDTVEDRTDQFFDISTTRLWPFKRWSTVMTRHGASMRDRNNWIFEQATQSAEAALFAHNLAWVICSLGPLLTVESSGVPEEDIQALIAIRFRGPDIQVVSDIVKHELKNSRREAASLREAGFNLQGEAD
jgi:hypothetical protein